MQRRERDEVLDGGDRRVVDQDRLGEAVAAVHDPVPDRGQRRRRSIAGPWSVEGVEGRAPSASSNVRDAALLGVVLGRRPRA